jgi:hypothetical protein
LAWLQGLRSSAESYIAFVTKLEKCDPAYQKCVKAAAGSGDDWDDFCGSLPATMKLRGAGNSKARSACYGHKYSSPTEKKNWCELQFEVDMSDKKLPDGPAQFAEEFRNTTSSKSVEVQVWLPVLDTERDCWICYFRIYGFNGGKISSIRSDNFIGATLNATEVIRRFFESSGEILESDIGSPEALFPRRLPIHYGLAFYRKIDRAVQAAIDKEEAKLTKKRTLKGGGRSLAGFRLAGSSLYERPERLEQLHSRRRDRRARHL